MNPKTHFHIRWSSTSRLDWKPFRSREDAEEVAKELVHQNETFAIEELNGDCERCAAGGTSIRRAYSLSERVPSAG